MSGEKGLPRCHQTSKTTEETRIHLPLIRSLHMQLPQIPMSFQDNQTMRSIADPLDKSA